MARPKTFLTGPIARALDALKKGDGATLAGVPDGFDAMLVADLARVLSQNADGPAVLVHVARDGQRRQTFENALKFLAPEIEVLCFPAWDCQPYDRVSPTSAVTSQRMTALARLARSRSSEEKPRILSTTANAVVQRVPPRAKIAAETFSAAPGNAVKVEQLVAWLEANGSTRTGTVREPGEYAVRGGIVDLHPPGLPLPVRLDFFGDTLESIRPFDPETQRSTGQLRSLDLVPVSEVQITSESIRRFRQAYVATFGALQRDDRLYEAVSEGRRYPGLEHWLPLFHERLDTLFDYVPGVPVVFDALVEDAAGERLAQVHDYYDARASMSGQGGGTPYRPLKPEALYLEPEEWAERVRDLPLARLTPFSEAQGGGRAVIDLEARRGRDFLAERTDPNANVFQAAADHIKTLQANKKRVIVASWSEGSRERLGHVLEDHGIEAQTVARFAETTAWPRNKALLAVWGLDTGFEAGDLAVVGEQDILGDRLVRQKRASKRPQDFLAEVSALTPGDLVVHVDHGIGRFDGLKSIEAAGAPHDCLEITYAGDARLFLPVENIELLSRYGSEETEVQLDKLGGGGWQARKAKMKQRIREMAGQLIKVAAQRFLKPAPKITPAEGLYDEFAARFPYDETEDQLGAIEAVMEDLAAGRPMDRLVCGDVGFGKTEVALRAAFAVAMSGKQVAVVVPTTLLARQHFKGFVERFRGLPVNVAHASRFVSAAELKAVKAGAADGSVDIVVGTHALLGKGMSFKDLGLIIVDEEQHFGVAHKERLKELRAEVHVLTLTATPIPRTLQLALTGVRELSIIATPPVDRLAVRTFVTPFDPLSIREALLRERYRGGQAFYVVPRVSDLADIRSFLAREVPEVSVAVAHGQMAATQLEDVMSAFYDGKFDVLLSTTIVESGLDIPTANTLIVHRADMFGLSQLYQLRGRVGRSKTRAYALFTVPEKKPMTVQAERRLKVLQSLDTLGAGFQLATHDLDIRGAGNLLGDEQSGHIKEVGYELYQQMLEDAIEQLKAGIDDPPPEQWSPTIQVGAPVTIPESFVSDLQLRLGLYRRLSTFETEEEIAAFRAELVDRFGKLPKEVDQLLAVVGIKVLCRQANIERVEGGPKGIIVSFRENEFANPAGLVAYVAEQGTFAKVRPDMKVVFLRDVDDVAGRLDTTKRLVRDLVSVSKGEPASALKPLPAPRPATRPVAVPVRSRGRAGPAGRWRP
ncbi:transcription-repair coupling factor [Enterovirga rhinocerotis]|uniref:Transcription-repair-coupling factor n=1 Tax=Enterovirga rhinocerotis TaxID=1339210 RepID=A0A4R7C6A3_9HYPH|nr:transcription-repair coupling factor [Enterovirga rhinocerotis]TDR93928.1 transcription-repair coupling factor [Enterovirga rhinocerotis]